MEITWLRPAEPEAHRDFARQRSDGRRRHHVHGALPPVAGVIEAVLLLGKFVAAAAGADDDADLPQFVASHRGGIDPRRVERFLHGGDRQRRDARHVRPVLGRDVILLAKSFDLARNLDREIGRVESGDRARCR